ncbi:hypothetical protein WDW37_18805 [Bdellovibrionota bacterium FG-1]
MFCRRLLTFSFALSLLGFSVTPSYAEAGRSVLDLEREIEVRLTPIIKGADAYSLFYVRVTPQTAKSTLPMTPFVLRDLNKEDASGRIRIQKLQVTLLTKSGKFSDAGLQLITEFTKSYGVKPEITLQKIPSDFALSKTIDENEEAKTLAKNDRDQKNRSPASAQADPTKPEASPANTFDDPRLAMLDPLLKSPRIMLASGLSLLAFFVFSMILSGFLRRKGIARLTASVERATEQLSSALEKSKGRGEASAEQKATAESSGGTEGGGAQAELQLRNFEAFPEEGLKALLADCYWAEQDTYAAFIWKEIPLGKRKSLITTLPFLKDYLSYIVTLMPADLGVENEPYYLAPFEIHHLSNQKLTELTRQTPHLLKQFPKLRSEALQLSVRERIEFDRQAPKAGVALPDFSKVAASALRAMKRKTVLKLKTVEEEQELLNLPNLTMDVLESVQSLGWLLRLQPTQIEQVLKEYSAKELAQVWLAPKTVLEQLQKHMPPKKVEMLQGYTSSLTPERDHPIMNAIHEQTLQQLRAALTGAPKLETPKKAA